MKNIFLLVFTCAALFQTQAYSQIINSNPHQSYSENAKQIIWPQLIELSEMLTKFDSETLPHETKLLRKKVGYCRFFIDLFVFTYPIDSPETDYWARYRKILDEGYGTLGDYKDLFDIMDKKSDEIFAEDYDQRILKKLNKKVQKWIKQFHQENRHEKAKIFWENPLHNYTIIRPQNKISKIIWSQVKTPKLSLNLHQSL